MDESQESIDTNSQKTYKKGKFLGKGGFAKCYSFTCLSNNKIYAGKVIPKSTLKKSNAKQKLLSQIKIHKSLSHQHIVGFQSFFEDQKNVYIILELCSQQTLNQLVKRRKRLHEMEAKYYLHQLLLAIKYMKNKLVIHRDLKFGNLFLAENLQIKIGDFGLAAKLSHPFERKKTVCGTPNYIAPQVLESKQGHSFQVDIWSFGVIMYAMILGIPPFQTRQVKETYKKIKNCLYDFPPIDISQQAKQLIKKILKANPNQRPSVQELLNDPYFYPNHVLKSLPIWTLACPPNQNLINQYETLKQYSFSMKLDELKIVSRKSREWVTVIKYLKLGKGNGLGYVLSNGAVGLLLGKQILLTKGTHFINKTQFNQSEFLFDETISDQLKRKKQILIKLIEYFNRHVAIEECYQEIFVKKWIQYENWIIFRISNGIVQMIGDREIALCGQKKKIAIIQNQNFNIYNIQSLLKQSDQEMTILLFRIKQILNIVSKKQILLNKRQSNTSRWSKCKQMSDDHGSKNHLKKQNYNKLNQKQQRIENQSLKKIKNKNHTLQSYQNTNFNKKNSNSMIRCLKQNNNILQKKNLLEKYNKLQEKIRFKFLKNLNDNKLKYRFTSLYDLKSNNRKGKSQQKKKSKKVSLQKNQKKFKRSLSIIFRKQKKSMNQINKFI